MQVAVEEFEDVAFISQAVLWCGFDDDFFAPGPVLLLLGVRGRDEWTGGESLHSAPDISMQFLICAGFALNVFADFQRASHIESGLFISSEQGVRKQEKSDQGMWSGSAIGRYRRCNCCTFLTQENFPAVTFSHSS